MDRGPEQGRLPGRRPLAKSQKRGNSGRGKVQLGGKRQWQAYAGGAELLSTVVGCRQVYMARILNTVTVMVAGLGHGRFRVMRRGMSGRSKHHRHVERQRHQQGHQCLNYPRHLCSMNDFVFIWSRYLAGSRVTHVGDQRTA